MFALLGNRVIAVEPNADCVRHIELSYPQYSIEVIHAVAGAKSGLAKLNLSNERDDVSSLSSEWIEAMKAQHSEYSNLWQKTVTVPMLTLDSTHRPLRHAVFHQN